MRIRILELHWDSFGSGSKRTSKMRIRIPRSLMGNIKIKKILDFFTSLTFPCGSGSKGPYHVFFIWVKKLFISAPVRRVEWNTFYWEENLFCSLSFSQQPIDSFILTTFRSWTSQPKRGTTGAARPRAATRRSTRRARKARRRSTRATPASRRRAATPTIRTRPIVAVLD